MTVSLPEVQTIIVAAIVIAASGFLTKAGEAAWERLHEEIKRRRQD